jgi:hypothetical protein
MAGLGGPGVDPHYNGTTTEATAWGAAQAARALSDIANGAFDYKVVWMDIEMPGITPAPDNGWNGSGPCAQFFGGQTSANSHAVMWQWSGGGGATNGIGGFNGDLDTIDIIALLSRRS